METEFITIDELNLPSSFRWLMHITKQATYIQNTEYSIVTFFCWQATEDKTFIENNIQYLEKEFQYWMANRTKVVRVNGKDHKLARYNVQVDDPRPGNVFYVFRSCHVLYF